MQTAQRKQNMPGNYQFGAAVHPRSESRQRIIAGHMRVNYLDILLAHDARKLPGARGVEGITQRQQGNIFRGQWFQGRADWRFIRQRQVQFMTTPAQTADELDKMRFAAAQSTGRTYLQNSHAPENRRKNVKPAITL